MKVKGIVGLGTRTAYFDAMANMFQKSNSLSHEAMQDGYAWAHCRAPDGFIYALTYDPKHPSP